MINNSSTKDYKTLDEIFPEGKGDGRKFTLETAYDDYWFIPYFRENTLRWYGLDMTDTHLTIYEDWKVKEWVPPKKTKKVTMYTPVYKSTKMSIEGHLVADCSWHQEKTNFQSGRDLVGYMTMEVEIEE